MLYRRLLVFALIGLLAIAVGVVGLGRAGQAFDRTSSGPETPAYALPGPHVVGIRSLSIEAATSLDLTMWYPALNEDIPAQDNRYPYEIKLGDPFGKVAIASYAGQSAREAPFKLAAGPYPLVILSPGFSIGTSAYAWLAEHLASYGFVLIAPEHQEHLDPQDQLWRATIARPQDIRTLLVYVDEQTQPGGAFDGLINPEQVAVIGHSYGGTTALEAAGARLDTERFQSHCQGPQAEEDPNTFLCEQLYPHVSDMAALAGLDSIPAGLWPAWGDPGIDAIIPMAGDAFFFGQSGLANIAIPVMAIGGTLDPDSPFQWGSQLAYDSVSSPRKVKIALDEAEHMVFTGMCEKSPFYLKPLAGEFCNDPGWDRGYAHDLIRHFTTAFLQAELQGDSDAAAMLAPDAVTFQSVTYEAQGYEIESP